ncbi:hypothetical protein BJX63DRAFT_415068 [Aspergillus granulosus]|uniref:Uncharacterized protein n=1 Tax=Aspergillus granulosus TaxID=176169 RepID=A0ABR4GTR8_9EURO
MLACLSPPISQGVIDVFANVGQYSRVIQHYATDACGPAILDLLGDSRNLVHHRLFSLPNGNDDLKLVVDSCGYATEDIQLTREIYLLTRLSVILYAVHVSFPTPRSTRLREQLLTALSPMFHKLVGRAPGPLILWCLVIVVLSSGDTAPSQLLGYVVRLCVKLKVDSKEKLVRLLCSFAWVECAVPDTAPFWILAGNIFVQAARATLALRKIDDD